MRTLILGDIHLEDKYPGYLEAQSACIHKIVSSEQPDTVVFLGDIFQFRKPDPATLLALRSLLQELSNVNRVSKIILLRGNHDSTTKGDNNITALSLFNDRKVKVVDHSQYLEDLNFVMIPHYEDELIIIKQLETFKDFHDANTVYFGHFGFEGCLNTAGDEDFKLSPKMFSNLTILGHIHKPRNEGHIIVLGTPYSTGFGEVDYKHHYAVLTRTSKGKPNLEFKDITHGPRYMALPLDALESNKDLINDKNYFTILRVLMSKLDGFDTVDLRKKLLEKYRIKYIDIKYIPLIDKKSAQSGYNTTELMTELTEDIINKYIEEQRTSLPESEIRKGLELLKHEVAEDSN